MYKKPTKSHLATSYGRNFFVNICSDRSGVALVLSLGIVAIFALLIIHMQIQLLPAIRRSAASESADRAMITLDGAKDMGLSFASDLRVGEALEGYVCYDDSVAYSSGEGDGSIDTICEEGYKQSFAVEALSDCVKDSGGINCKGGVDRYLIPAPGTGNAGENCQITTNYSGALGVNDDIVKPCNWNKLKFGETDAIPLYIDDGDPATPNVADPDLSEFTIKVRAPCEEIVYEADGKRLKGTLTPGLDHPEDVWCGEGPGVERFDLYDSAPTVFSGSDVIVYWQITGTCDYEPAVGQETADDALDGNCTGMGVGESVDLSKTHLSVITKDIIGDYNNIAKYGLIGTRGLPDMNRIDDLNVPFEAADKFPTIVEYITDNLDLDRNELPNFPNLTSRILTEPVLYISVVSPISIQGGVAPYIEYQIESDVKLPTPYQTIHASGTWGIHTFADTVYRKIIKATPQFVISN